ncbi:C40 family peptidase [Nonomuraea rubra]|uniref:Cell wall-associated NlpC family hydrolase n=1 Tax=Nonomuraea rubra TaxID=46180 RepID=A0A7X0U335_9ACTN|nr:C40 family peptidase [Nonomuraea rubra]MBB6553318.1 cell wall-associated NlpC family hydrolase [Nonomuraea rubra]
MKAAAAGAALLLLLVSALVAAATSILTSSGTPGGGACAITPSTVSSMASTPVAAPASRGAASTLDSEQQTHAALIVQIAMERGLPVRAAVIAVATAMQEAQLRNLRYGHLDSLGLFQQRPSQGWGTPEQILDPRYAITAFYDRLGAVRRWEQLPLTRAAQAVQRSGRPDAYAQWEPLAQRLVDALAGTCVPPIPGETIAAVLAYAHAQLAKPYLWGAEGPYAFDCSGLTMRAYQAAGIVIPRVAADQWRHGPPIPAGQEQPGDLAFFNMQADGPGHVGLVIGNGQMIHAPNRRSVVRIDTYQRRDLISFSRPIARAASTSPIQADRPPRLRPPTARTDRGRTSGERVRLTAWDEVRDTVRTVPLSGGKTLSAG